MLHSILERFEFRLVELFVMDFCGTFVEEHAGGFLCGFVTQAGNVVFGKAFWENFLVGFP